MCPLTAGLPACTQTGESFVVHHTSDKARAGVLQSAHGAVPTPAPLLYSFRGSPLNATPDIMDGLGAEPRALHMTAGEL